MRFIHGTGYVGIEGPFHVLSSAPWRGGFRRAERLVNVQVPMDFDHDVALFFRRFEREHRLRGSVGFLTAVDMRCVVQRRGPGFALSLTAGVGNPSKVGTINILLVVKGALSPAAYVELVKMVTEAKVGALYDLDVRAGDRPATGTSTDGVAIASEGRGKEIRYAGPATPLGRDVGRVVRRAVRDGLRAYHGWDGRRPISDRLRERGYPAEKVARVSADSEAERARWEAAFAQDDARAAGRLVAPPFTRKLMRPKPRQDSP